MTDEELKNIVNLNRDVIPRLIKLGILVDNEEDALKIRDINIGKSNYSIKTIQPWNIWLDYPELTPWDCDIIKRILRTKQGDSRLLDYQKIVHIVNERIRQLRYEI